MNSSKNTQKNNNEELDKLRTGMTFYYSTDTSINKYQMGKLL